MHAQQQQQQQQQQPLVERRLTESVDSLQLRRRVRKMTTDAPEESALRTHLFYILKAIELALGIINVGLAVDPYRFITETDVEHACLAHVAFSSVIIVSCVLLISRLAGEPVPVRATLLFLLVNGCLLIAAAGVVLADWCRLYYRIYNLQPKLFLDMMVGCGVIAVFNAAAHFVDVGLTVALS